MFLLLIGLQHAVATTFYVSAAGSDNWSGAYPSKHGHQGPFATVQQALNSVRSYRSLHPNLRGDVVIEVRGGEYTLTRPIVVEPEDSGTPNSKTIVKGFRQERPVLEGGADLMLRNTKLQGWVAHPQGPLPQQLYVDGERRYRPRWPRTGYAIVDRTVASTSDVGKNGFNRFGYSGNDIHPEWVMPSSFCQRL